MTVALPPQTPIAPPPLPPAPVATAPRPPAPTESPIDCTAAWAMVAVMCILKVATIVLIVMIAHGRDVQTIPVMIAINWPYAILFAVLLSLVPFGFWWRLVRVRAKRR